MRILLDYRPALRERSGVGEWAHQLVGALVSASGQTAEVEPLQVTVFSSSWKDRLRRDLPALAGARIVDRRVPVRLLNVAWHRLEWPPVEVLAGGPFDIVHSLHPLLLPTRNAARVVTIHDLDFLEHPERTRAEIRRDYPVLARSHAQRAEGVIVPSHYTAVEVQLLLEVPPERVSVCYPGRPDWEPRTTAPPPGEGTILFMGTLEPRKNLGALLDAYRLLLQRRRGVPPLVVAGRFTPAAAAWEETMARPPLASAVRRLGYVDPADRRRVYEAARVVVVPSLNEGFGFPALEAMTLGIPVVAASRGALPEVVGDAGLLVDPEDVTAIADAVDRICLDDALAAALGSRGIERAKRFHWTATASAVVESYRCAIAHRQG